MAKSPLKISASVSVGDSTFTETVAAGTAATTVDLSVEFSAVSPDEYEAEILPDGMTLNESTGVISGTPVEPGYFEVFCQGRGASGSDKLTRTMNVTAPVTSASTASALETALADHEANGTGPIIIELADGDYDPSVITEHVMTHWCLIRSATHNTDHSTVANWRGGARFTGGELALENSEKIRFEHVEFYIPKTGGDTNDQNNEQAISYRNCNDIHFALIEVYSDVIDKSIEGRAGNWPDGGPVNLSTSEVHGMHCDRMYYHDINYGPEIRSSTRSTETSTTKRCYETRCLFKDMGRGATSASGSFIYRKWCYHYGTHATARDDNPFHSSSFSYGHNGSTDAFNVINEAILSVPITTIRASASGIKLDDNPNNSAVGFSNSTILGCLCVSNQGIALQMHNTDGSCHVMWNAVVYNRDSSLAQVTGITDVGGTNLSMASPYTTLDVSADSPDLSNIPLDGSYWLLVDHSGDRGYRIVGVDNVAKTITINTPVRQTGVTSGLTWSINENRANPGISVSEAGGSKNRAIYAENLVSTFSLGRSGSIPDHRPAERNILATGFIANGDGSVDDGGVGDTDVIFENAFKGSVFTTVPQSDMLTNYEIEPSGPLGATATAPWGIGPIGTAFDWPATFTNRPSGVLRKAKLPDWTPDAITIPAVTGAATSTLTESAAVQITGIDDNVPVRLEDTADASADFQILDTDGVTVIRDWGDPKWNNEITPANDIIENNQYIKVRVNSSASAATEVTETIHVGTSDTTFSVTTA